MFHVKHHKSYNYMFHVKHHKSYNYMFHVKQVKSFMQIISHETRIIQDDVSRETLKL